VLALFPAVRRHKTNLVEIQGIFAPSWQPEPMAEKTGIQFDLPFVSLT
jgi:hypothetical protein